MVNPSQKSFVERVSTGIDYLTCSYEPSAVDGALDELIDATIVSERSKGNFVKPWSGYGYSGLKVGQFHCGERPDGRCVMLSGELAHESWARFAATASNVSRLDIEVTGRCGRQPAAEIARLLRAARGFSPPTGRPRKVGLRREWPQGMTLYLGSRQSAVYMRIYDKGAESGDDYYAGCVRIEAELKKGASAFMAAYLLRSPDREQAVCVRLSQLLAGSGGGSQLLNDTRYQLILTDLQRSPRCLSDIATSLSWLTTQVSPTVKRLIDAGEKEKVLEALGLR